MTIKEAQELVEAWNEKNSVYNSELSSVALLAERMGKLASAVSQKQSEPSMHHHDAPNPPLSNEIADIFWELLGLCNHTGVDMTEALICSLEKRAPKIY